MPQFFGDDIVEIAMQLELNGKAFYTAAAQTAVDPSIRALFLELAQQEQAHYEVFKSLLGNVIDAPAGQAQMDQATAYMRVVLERTFFKGEEASLAQAEEAKSDREALSMAIDFEKDTLLFYYDLRDQVVESQRGLVDRVIAEEKRHIQRLAALI